MGYEPHTIEPRWQAFWEERGTFRARLDVARPKYYVLDMFPYPSGEGLHVGHPKGYISTDVIARYKRMRGFNVLHPMGWDAFGLPAEQYAMQTGTHPRVTTQRNIETYRRQLKRLGLSYDWSREIDTTAPGYVKWTQWIFRKLHERGLAYQAEVAVNWCPALGTVLANEEVVDGRSERGGHPIVRKPMKQWMLRITEYAERLLADLDALDWPEHIKRMQVEWIGRSEGARISFPLAAPEHAAHTVEVFTTRPDTLFGATYLVLAPEHALAAELASAEQAGAVRAYIERALGKSERQRAASDEKTGVFTGAFAKNPASGEALPVWVADYVLAGYGSGAIMAVPAHDARDFAFATAHRLPIRRVVRSKGDAGADGDAHAEDAHASHDAHDEMESAHTAAGVAVNSGFLDGLDTAAAKARMCEWLEEHGAGARSVSYKLRDWLFSRQRYWGEPLPVLHLEDGSQRLLEDDELPLLLPELDDFHPSGEFETPLSRVPEWLHTTHRKSGARATRDPNTMPQWAGSCWYYLRFLDPHNERAPFSKEAERYWMPVDLYVGGAEHAVLHLLYARFWHKVLFDAGLVHTREPFQKLLNPGMILGHSYRYYDDNLEDDPAHKTTYYAASEVTRTEERARHAVTGAELRARWVKQAEVRRADDGRALHPHADVELEEVVEKMSKSRGNVVSPDAMIERFGADAMRLYELFMGPLEKGAPWSTEGIPGCHRFLQRSYRLFVDEAAGDATRALPEGTGTEAQARLCARTIAGVTADMEGVHPNTAIAKLMVFVREIAREAPLPRAAGEAFLKMLSLFAPHLAEELWAKLGHSESIAHEAWPEYDAALLETETVTLVVQVNGKRRAEIQAPKDASEKALRELALADENVARHIGSKKPRRVVIVPARLINIVL